MCKKCPTFMQKELFKELNQMRCEAKKAFGLTRKRKPDDPNSLIDSPQLNTTSTPTLQREAISTPILAEKEQLLPYSTQKRTKLIPRVLFPQQQSQRESQISNDDESGSSSSDGFNSDEE